MIKNWSRAHARFCHIIKKVEKHCTTMPLDFLYLIKVCKRIIDSNIDNAVQLFIYHNEIGNLCRQITNLRGLFCISLCRAFVIFVEIIFLFTRYSIWFQIYNHKHCKLCKWTFFTFIFNYCTIFFKRYIILFMFTPKNV